MREDSKIVQIVRVPNVQEALLRLGCEIFCALHDDPAAGCRFHPTRACIRRPRRD